MRPRSRSALAKAALLPALLLGGCREERGSTYLCSCSFLTDFDDGSTQEVTVCAPSDERAPGFASGCAQEGAPAPVERCSCRLEKSGAGCKVGACASRSRE
ncbi:hypothetical protein [Polyangium aurulentum]|uniref:hypothetical protein n=1 Tax=Polyangium aurulentum TaxID=2567896 RepID=UPI00146B6721|nr:hypothetical protein [Polyangium aurulentum]UQA59207.1 hypothetical protein E8A73_001425 [Polyangium aurulentum]